MAHSVSNLRYGTVGDRRTRRAKVTLTSYTTGGEVITAAELGLVYIEELFVEGPADATHQAEWDGAAGTSVEVSIYVDDAISGVPAESGTTNTDVFHVLAFGF